MGNTATRNCPVCDSPNTSVVKYNIEISANTVTMERYICPICGTYELKAYKMSETLDCNHMASYLVYNRFEGRNDCSGRYYTVLDNETCDLLKTNPDNGRPVHLDSDMIENWYPKTFSERVDKILLYCADHTPHVGNKVFLKPLEAYGVAFIERWSSEDNKYFPDSSMVFRAQADLRHELRFMLGYMKECDYINYSVSEEPWIQLMPKGYERIDFLQRNLSTGKNAFVAMQFGEKTKLLREAIRKGITQAGYNAIFIDEVHHNNLITPEILKYIQDSKFVVVDLTYGNQGAYFEEGYAMGIGKPVIQLCKKNEKLHFDIAQKNTIIWSTEEEVPDRLTNRIKATID